MNNFKMRDSVKDLAKKAIRILPDKVQMKIRYFKHYGRFPNIDNPKNFSEKILNRIYYDRNYLYTKLADKYLVRNFIKELIGEEYLVPLRYVFEQADDLATMPEWHDSVIKPSHASGMVEIILEEPTDERKNEIISKCRAWLKIDYSKHCQEYHYKKMPRKLLVEKSLCINGKLPIEYKIHCFPQPNGDLLTVLQITTNRYTDALARMFFLSNDFDNQIRRKTDPSDVYIPEEAKGKLREALNLCKILSMYFNYVRVDWYIVENNLYFGELTFTPSAGMLNEILGADLERIMFDYWRL